MSRPQIMLVVLVTSSLLAVALGAGVLRLRLARLSSAATYAVEIVGFGLGFYALNTAIIVTATLVARSLATFLSLYLSDDVVLLLLSLVQGVVFAVWRRSARDAERA